MSSDADWTCAGCGDSVSAAISQSDHALSLSHMLGTAPARAQKKVTLPTGNVGYKLMQKMGWSEDVGTGGLGKHGTGRVEPVATMFKEDKRGVGAKFKRPATSSATAGTMGSAAAVVAGDGRQRVTHFRPHSEYEASKSTDTLSSAQREQLARQSRGSLSLQQVQATHAAYGPAKAAAILEAAVRPKGARPAVTTDARDAGNDAGATSSSFSSSSATASGASSLGIARKAAKNAIKAAVDHEKGRKERKEERKQTAYRHELLSDWPAEYAALFLKR